MADLDAAKETLLAELRERSLILGEVTLSSGATAQYYGCAPCAAAAGGVPRGGRADRRVVDRLAGGAERIEAAATAP